MLAALEDLRAGRTLVETAANYHIPRSTLYVRARAHGIALSITRQEHSGERVQAAVQAVAGKLIVFWMLCHSSHLSLYSWNMSVMLIDFVSFCYALWTNTVVQKQSDVCLSVLWEGGSHCCTGTLRKDPLWPTGSEWRGIHECKIHEYMDNREGNLLSCGLCYLIVTWSHIKLHVIILFFLGGGVSSTILPLTCFCHILHHRCKTRLNTESVFVYCIYRRK